MKALRRTLPLLIGLSLIPLATNCCFPFFWGEPKVWVEEEEELFLSAAGIESLSVETHNGYITIEAVPGAEEISVHAKKRAGGSDSMDATACMEAIRLYEKVVGNEQLLGWEWEKDKKRNWGSHVSFEIRIPAGIGVSADTHNGDISITGTSGDASITTHNGNLKVRGHVGDLYASTHNGSMEIESLSTDIKLATHNGMIKARLLEVPELGGFIESHNGDIRLALEGEPSVRIDCGTHNGSIDMDKEIRVTRIERNRFKGTIGDGSSKLRIETHNGSIVID